MSSMKLIFGIPLSSAASISSATSLWLWLLASPHFWDQTESFQWDQWPNQAPHCFQGVHNPIWMDPIHEDL